MPHRTRRASRKRGKLGSAIVFLCETVAHETRPCCNTNTLVPLTRTASLDTVAQVLTCCLRGSKFLKSWMEFLEENADLRYPNLADVYVDEQNG